MSLRRHIIYFDVNPSQEEAIRQLRDLTGFAIEVNQISPNCMSLRVQTNRIESVEIDWIQQRKGKDIEKILGEKFVYPFPDKKECIRVESESKRLGYLEVSLLYLLKRMGGEVEKDFHLPEWAGRRWKPKVGIVESFRLFLHQFFN